MRSSEAPHRKSGLAAGAAKAALRPPSSAWAQARHTACKTCFHLAPLRHNLCKTYQHPFSTRSIRQDADTLAHLFPSVKQAVLSREVFREDGLAWKPGGPLVAPSRSVQARRVKPSSATERPCGETDWFPGKRQGAKRRAGAKNQMTGLNDGLSYYRKRG